MPLFSTSVYSLNTLLVAAVEVTARTIQISRFEQFGWLPHVPIVRLGTYHTLAHSHHSHAGSSLLFGDSIVTDINASSSRFGPFALFIEILYFDNPQNIRFRTSPLLSLRP